MIEMNCPKREYGYCKREKWIAEEIDSWN